MKGRRWNFVLMAVALLMLAALVPIAYVEALCRAPLEGYAPGMRYQPVLPVAERRPEGHTWTQYPRWHVVYSAQSLGRHLATAPPSSYSYWQDVRSFWSSYCLINRIAGDLRGGTEAKLGIYAMGLGFSGGMLARGLYENSIGRLLEWIGGWRSEDDRHAARVQQRYAVFTRQSPWYRFPYAAAFGGLWQTNSSASPLGEGGLTSPAVAAPKDRTKDSPSSEASAKEGGVGAFLRHWERRLALSTVYGLNTGSAKAFKTGADYIGGGREPATLRLVARASRGQLAAAGLKPLRGIEADQGGGTVAEAPRGPAFTTIVERLAARRIPLVEIAGNDDVFVTFLTRRTLNSGEGVVLFALAVPDRPGLSRVGVSTKVPRLAALLRDARAAGATLEHAYDY